jgi:hypothetical protein
LLTFLGIHYSLFTIHHSPATCHFSLQFLRTQDKDRIDSGEAATVASGFEAIYGGLDDIDIACVELVKAL